MNRKTILWEGCYDASTEYVEITQGESIIVRGNIAGQEEGIPYFVSYLLHLDQQWVVQSVSINLKSINSTDLYFEKKNDVWFNKEGRELPELKDCVDVDLSLTPFTNTLPVRRLKLATGASEEIRLLYFKLPEGEFRPMAQRYTNIDGRFYKYENVDDEYAALLEMDDEGMVVFYPGRWQRVFPAIE